MPRRDSANIASLLEPLEPRCLLTGGLAVTGLTPAGGPDHPFDVLRVRFSEPVQDGSFTSADVTMTEPGGPVAVTVTRLEPALYELAAGGTGLSRYDLSIGPQVLTEAGQPMNQDGDVTPGEPGQDAYVGVLTGSGVLLGDEDLYLDGRNLVLYGGTSIVWGAHSFASLGMFGGAVLTHLGHDGYEGFDLRLAVAGGLVIDSTSRIDVTGKGYPVNATAPSSPHGSTSLAGGSYGGLGGDSDYEWWGSGSTVYAGTGYGDFRNPNDLGSGGSAWFDIPGGAGGGLVRISAASAVIDGAIVADGAAGGWFNDGISDIEGGCGSGGGVWLSVGELGGTGRITADGGGHSDGLTYFVGGGGGGGGRIAVYYDSLDGFDLSGIRAAGGTVNGLHPGGAGTIYLHPNGGSDLLLVTSGGRPAGMWTIIGAEGDAEIAVDELRLSGAGVVVRPHHQLPVRAGDLTIASGASLSHLPATETETYGLDVDVAGTLRVEAGARIDASAMGYLPGRTHSNSTQGAAMYSFGGSYGGLGAHSIGYEPGIAYGDFRDPTEPGAGSGPNDIGRSGGGLVRLRAGTAILDGDIVATTGPEMRQGSGAGSGGGIRLDVGTLSGTGVISADSGGRGGGGRVAVYYATLSGFDLSHITALGGGSDSWSASAPGTVYLEQTGQAGLLRIDTGGQPAGQYTPLGAEGDTEVAVDNLVVSGAGAMAVPHHQMPIRADNLTLQNGAVLSHLPATETESYSLDVTVAGELTVDATSRIDVSSLGYVHERGKDNLVETGAQTASGGSYGGLGGAYADGYGGFNWTPGPSYGDYRNPDQPGSGGAAYDGGPGGGLARISAGRAVIDGRIQADGKDVYAATGSGGGIRLDVGELAGAGWITADGGDVPSDWSGWNYGSGGGGRVALYYTALAGFDVAHVTALPGLTVAGHAGLAGSVGTVFLQQQGQEGQLRLDSHGRAVDRWTPLGQETDTEFQAPRLVLTGLGVQAVPEHPMPLRLMNLDILGGASLSHVFCTASLEQRLDLVVTGTITIDAASAIDVSGRGYQSNYTAGNRVDLLGRLNAGGSYAGRGGGSSGAQYGDAQYPDLPGAGAHHTFMSLPGGGMAAITAGAILLDGDILADGTDGDEWNAGAAGGSVRINAGTISGGGTVSARGGDGMNGGGGGRIALYPWTGNLLPADHVSAQGGSLVGVNGQAAGGSGSVVYPGAGLYWRYTQNGMFHGLASIEWEMVGVDPAGVTVDLTADRDGQNIVIATGVTGATRAAWDTTTLANGEYVISAIARDGSGHEVGRNAHLALINNSVAWHGGLIADTQMWAAGTVHVVERTVALAGTLTIQPGAIVKFLDDTGIHVLSGGTLNMPATAAEPIILTSLADDTVGGDLNFDSGAATPRPGAWFGVMQEYGATINQTSQVEFRYLFLAHEGTVSGNEVWSASNVHYVTNGVDVANNSTLTIMPGAVVKFADWVRLTVYAGSKLVAEGATALPIIFTSLRDDQAGGDTNADGTASTPLAGDWDGLYIQGQASLDHVELRYGGGTQDNIWRSTGLLVVNSDLGVTVANSVLRDAFFDGILALGGPLEVRNTVITRTDRAVLSSSWNAVPQIVNCALDDNRIGVMVTQNTIRVTNSLITRSAAAGVHTPGDRPIDTRYTDVWSPLSGSVNYLGTPDVTGQNGNISADPIYRDRQGGDYGLTAGSPAIDAGDGAAASATDFRGAPRFDDPLTANTGTPAGNDFADLGAFEYVDQAASNVDITITGITSPASAAVGQEVLLEWTVKNVGAEAATGPWRDSVYLAMDAANPSLWHLAGEPAVGEGVVLQPGEDFTASARVTVPPGYQGANYWLIVANSHSDLFEGHNHGNNTYMSDQTVDVTYPVLTVDAAGAQGQFTQSGQSQWFVVQADQVGQDVLLSLGLSGSGLTELYVSAGRPVSRGDYDLAGLLGQASQRVQITDAMQGQPYYVLAYAASVPAARTFTLSAVTPLFGIDSVSPAVGGNVGNVTVEIRGSKIPDGVLPVLIGPDGSKYYGGNLYYVDPTVVYATFDLAGAVENTYDLRLITPDGAVTTESGAFQIAAGQGGRLQAQLILPAVVRAGRPYTFQIEYANVGDGDLISPILRVSTGDQRPMGLTADRNDGLGELNFLGYSSTGPAGILRAGVVERVTVYSMATLAASAGVQYWLTSQSVDPAHPRFDKIDWRSLRAKYLPGDTTDNYSPLWQVFASTMGGTWDELTAHLAAMLTEQVRQGEPPDAVVSHLMQQAYAEAMDRGGGLADNETPWVLAALPNEGASGGLESVDLVFSKTMDVDSFDDGDIAIATPTGTLSAVVTALSGRVWRVSFQSSGQAVTPKDKGRYTLILQPNVADTSGLTLDQDRDGVMGESADDAFTTGFDLQSTHLLTPVLHVVGQWPDGQVDVATGTGLSAIPGANPPLPGPYGPGGIDRLTVQFSRPVQFLTFTPRDVTLTGPDGSPIPVTAVRQLSSTIWQVEFPRQKALGRYDLTIGNEVRDQDTYPLDQDLDGVIDGKPGEQYRGSFTLVDVHGPQVVAQTPEDYFLSDTDHVDIAFSEPIAPGSFTTGDVAITGPGAVAITGVESLNATTFRIHFDTLAAVGRYDITVGPGITDTAGNAMDQDQDGVNGAAGDVYAGRFFVLVAPGTNIIQSPSDPALVGVSPLAMEGEDPADHVIFSGKLTYPPGLGEFFPIPHVRIQLWEKDGDQDYVPGRASGAGGADDLISQTNLLTGADILDAKGAFLFDRDLTGLPIPSADADTPAEGASEFYVVVIAENDSAVLVDETDARSARPEGDEHFFFSITTGSGAAAVTKWYRRVFWRSAVRAGAPDAPGANVEMINQDYEIVPKQFAAAEWLRWGRSQFKGIFGEDPRGLIRVVTKVANADTANYNDSSDFINLGDNSVADPWSILHEYGHAIHGWRNGFHQLSDPANPWAGTRGGVNYMTHYGHIRQSNEYQVEADWKTYIADANPPLYHKDVAYYEGWASFVASKLLESKRVYGRGLCYGVAEAVGPGVNLEANNWWMGYDGFGFANNRSVPYSDTGSPTGLLAGFYLDGINNDASTGEVVMGGVMSWMWDLADGAGDDTVADPRGLWAAFKQACASGSTSQIFWNVSAQTAGYKAVFIDHGIPAADDDFEGNDVPHDAYNLGIVSIPMVYNGLVLAEEAKGAGDWYKFHVPADNLASPGDTYDLTIRLDWNGQYGDLDIYARNLDGGEEQKAILTRAQDHELLVFRGLHSDQDYNFLVGVAGYGALDELGDPSDAGGDMVPDYSLSINPGGVPMPDDDDDGPDPDDPHWPPDDPNWPPDGPWPKPEDDKRNREGGSHDPNELVGPAGAGADGYVLPGMPMPYTVFFENSGPQAQFPAQEVIITNQLDADLDWTSFAVTEIVFDNRTITVPAANARYFHTTLDLRPERNTLIDVEAGVDLGTGLVFCNLRALDPGTNDLPEDPLLGVLPVNDANHSGEGHVSYVVNQAAALPTGRPITNQASIVFDLNDAMDTNVVLNTIDATVPVSRITTPSASQGAERIALEWQADDTGSGLAAIELYVSDNQAPFVLAWQGLGGSFTYSGLPDHSYRFYTVAVDAAGNREAPPAGPDVTIALWPTTTTTLEGRTLKLLFADADGTPVTVTWSGAGSAVIERWDNPANHRGDIRTITAASPDGRGILSLVTKGTGAAALTTIGSILVHSAMTKISAKAASLLGDAIVDGALTTLVLGDVLGANRIEIDASGAAVGPKSAATITLGRVIDCSLDAHLEPVKSLTALEWLDSGTPEEIQAPYISALNLTGRKANLKAGVTAVPGDFAVSLKLTGQDARVLSLGKLTIAGTITGGTWTLPGGAGAIRAAGTAASWQATVGGALASLTSTVGDLAGQVKAASIATVSAKRDFSAILDCAYVGSLKVGRDMLDASVNLTRPPDARLQALGSLTVGQWIDSSRVLSAGTIGTVKAGGMRNSDVFAGVAVTRDVQGVGGAADSVLDQPAPGDLAVGAVDPKTHLPVLAAVKALTLTGIKDPLTRQYITSFVNSSIAAGALGKISLSYAGLDNDGDPNARQVPFGLVGGSIASVSYKDADKAHTFTWTGKTALPNWLAVTDLEIRRS